MSSLKSDVIVSLKASKLPLDFNRFIEDLEKLRNTKFGSGQIAGIRKIIREEEKASGQVYLPKKKKVPSKIRPPPVLPTPVPGKPPVKVGDKIKLKHVRKTNGNVIFKGPFEATVIAVSGTFINKPKFKAEVLTGSQKGVEYSFNEDDIEKPVTPLVPPTPIPTEPPVKAGERIIVKHVRKPNGKVWYKGPFEATVIGVSGTFINKPEFRAQLLSGSRIGSMFSFNEDDIEKPITPSVPTPTPPVPTPFNVTKLGYVVGDIVEVKHIRSSDTTILIDMLLEGDVMGDITPTFSDKKPCIDVKITTPGIHQGTTYMVNEDDITGKKMVAKCDVGDIVFLAKKSIYPLYGETWGVVNDVYLTAPFSYRVKCYDGKLFPFSDNEIIKKLVVGDKFVMKKHPTSSPHDITTYPGIVMIVESINDEIIFKSLPDKSTWVKGKKEAPEWLYEYIVHIIDKGWILIVGDKIIINNTSPSKPEETRPEKFYGVTGEIVDTFKEKGVSKTIIKVKLDEKVVIDGKSNKFFETPVDYIEKIFQDPTVAPVLKPEPPPVPLKVKSVDAIIVKLSSIDKTDWLRGDEEEIIFIKGKKTADTLFIRGKIHLGAELYDVVDLNISEDTIRDIVDNFEITFKTVGGDEMKETYLLDEKIYFVDINNEEYSGKIVGVNEISIKDAEKKQKDLNIKRTERMYKKPEEKIGFYKTINNKKYFIVVNPEDFSLTSLEVV